MVKKSRGGQTINSFAEIEKNVKSVKLKKKKLGAILIEVAFTLPIVVYLMFFCIELIKINITQEALQSICEEATYLTIAHDYTSGADLIAKVDAIIEKYRPSFIPKEDYGYPGYTTKYPVIRWVYARYDSMSDMLNQAPYGGTCVYYPWYERYDMARDYHAGNCYGKGVTQFVPANGMEISEIPERVWQTTDYMKAGGLPNNAVFTLTVTCNYPFSSSLVKMLFGGGVNTKVSQKAGTSNFSADSAVKGTMYLLWARGAGVVNAK